MSEGAKNEPRTTIAATAASESFLMDLLLWQRAIAGLAN
jgi:hypothetical protein